MRTKTTPHERTRFAVPNGGVYTSTRSASVRGQPGGFYAAQLATILEIFPTLIPARCGCHQWAFACNGTLYLGVEPHWLQIVERDLPVAGLPPSLEEARIAQLSDLHIGPRIDDAYLLDAFARVRAQVPEIVVFRRKIAAANGCKKRWDRRMVTGGYHGGDNLH